MKPPSSAMLLLVVLVVTGVGWQYHRNNAQPFEVTGLYDQAGRIKKGTQVSHTVRFTNTGSSPLVLDAAVVGCACTDVDINRAVIAPGASRIVHVTVDTSDMGDGPQLSLVDFVLHSGSREWTRTATTSVAIQ